MGTVYQRAGSPYLWIAWRDNDGRRHYRSTGLPPTERARAERLLQAIERKLEAERQIAPGDGGPVTLRAYGEQWLKRRPGLGVARAGDEAQQWRDYIAPQLGAIKLGDLRIRHVRDWVRWLRSTTSAKTGRPLAPRSVHTIYGLLHRILRDAVIDELLPENPCQLAKGDLPRKVDADPLWRNTAVFSREEAERLISDERIPEDRRTRYALLFLAGLRPGEMISLRWRAVDLQAEPLGRMQVVVAWDSRRRCEVPPKKGILRDVPIHPTLAKVLARWKLSGWCDIYGRAPGPDDLVVPSRELREKSAPHINEDMKEDLALLGFRPRRTYDTRRTFTSLARGDGGRKDLIDWVIHGPKGDDTADMYTTLPWPALCAEVAKLRISLREGQVIELRAAAGAPSGGYTGVTDAMRNEKAPQPREVAGPSRVGDAGFEPATPAV